MWRTYVPVATRRAKARREMNKLRKKGKDIAPVEVEGRSIARSVWGKRWCVHLESYSDYANRLPRGRTYVRNGSVCHLEIRPGRIEAIVSGSELYRVSVRIKELKAAHWKSIKARCSGQIASMLELLKGKLSDHVMGVVSDRDKGLFPKPREIDFSCTCPDWAAMCKHVASVLYGVGARLDRSPESLFLLRGVDAEELIAAEMTLPDAGAPGDDSLADDALAGIFGIDIDTEAVSHTASVPPTAKAPAATRKGTRQRDASATGRRTARTARQAPDEGRKAVRQRGASATGRAAASPAGKAKRASAAGTPAGKRERKATPGASPGQKAAVAAAPRRRSAAGTARAAPVRIRPTGKSVARMRKKLGLSVARFADRLGVSPVTVYRWEATPGRLNLQARPLNALAQIHRRLVTSKK